MSRSALALCVAGLVACSHGHSTADAGQSCQLSSDCPGTDVCVNKLCIPICHQTSECASQGADLVCEEGICTKPACGSNAECGAQACISGSCTTPTSSSDIASCEVTPNPADAIVGAALPLKALALDSNGEALVWSNFTWTASAGTVDASGNLTTSGPGDVTVTATVTGTTKSCTSTVHSYAGAGSNFRVTVINMVSKEPIAGARVLIDPGTSQTTGTTGADGTYTTTFTGTAVAHDVHVFAVGYDYNSYIQTNATDLLVPMAPYINDATRSGFTSHMCDATKADDPVNGDPNCPPQGDFSPLADQGQAVHLAFFGTGVPNSLLDISVDTLVGPLHPVTISIAGTTKTVNLPWGLVLGVGSNFFGTNDYRVFTDAGVRALWGVGGNINLSSVVSIITPLLNNSTGGNIDLGTLLPQLLGFVGNLQAGAVVGVKSPANGTSTFDNTKPVALNSRMRLQVNATSPKLPKLDGVYLDGVIAIVGAMDYPIGYVPLGITAGLSAQDGSGGVLDPTCDTSGGKAPCDTNKLPMKFAPESGGTEGSKVGVALLAVNFGGLTPGSTNKVAISGLVSTQDAIPYTKPGDTPPSISLPANFLNLPASTSVTATHSTRNISITGDANPASAAQLYRFELESNARLTWNVWMPPAGSASATRSVYLPDPTTFNTGTTPASCDATATLCDPFNQTPTARLLSMQLSGVTTPENVESFGALRLDELGTALTAFTALQVNVQ